MFKIRPKDSLERSKLVAGFNSTTIAAYDPRTQMIVLNDYESDDIQNMKEASSDRRNEFAGIIIHEFTHWIDHVSSLWGQNNLLKWFGGVNAWRSGDETRFSSIITARQALKQTKYSTYFSTIEIADKAKAREGMPWQAQPTVGFAFDARGQLRPDYPVLFTRFSTFDGESIGRVPISVGALFEVNAIAAGVLLDVMHVRKTDDIVEQKLRESKLKGRYLDLLYSADYVEYSVADHCLANSVKNSDFLLTYDRAALLSEVAMNLSPKLFQQIRLPDGHEVIADAHRHFLARCDAGYAYWCLCKHASSDFDLDPTQWTELTLENTGLPRLDTVVTFARDEMDSIATRIDNHASNERLRELLSYGREVFRAYGLQRVQNMPKIYLESKASGRRPIILLGDDTIFDIGDAWISVKSDSVGRWFNEMWDFDSWSESFENACIP